MSDVRLNCAVIRGEIDNTRRGSVTLKLWLVGQEAPVSFILEGDCLRDLAGAHIHFVSRPLEEPKPIDHLFPDEVNGQAGEITASSRLCMHRPKEMGGYDKPVLVNVLRVEVFCSLGRILLESFDFSSVLIEKAWVMSEEEEFAQRAGNFAAWQYHIESFLKLDRESDGEDLANLYDEIHQRFADTFDFDQNEVALMGWNGILNALAEESASAQYSSEKTTPKQEGKDALELEAFLAEEFLSDEEWDEEPWAEEARGQHALVLSIKELIEDFELQAAHLAFPRGRHYQSLMSTLSDIETGLGELLNPSTANEVPVNVCLIGCREHLGQMMIAFHFFSKLIEITETQEGRRELLFLRDSMLDLRESISALRFQMDDL